ncbi:MAG TPA: transglutaminase family protein [Ilumatobacteraceae bacterium]|nr:transglutaminase family protein [Ilumatobacteraceae bacterium]
MRGRHDVEQFEHDEFLESLPNNYDSDALIGADRATYVIHQTVAYEYAVPVRDLRQRLMVMPRERHGDQQRVVHRFDVRTHGNKRVRTRADRFGNTVVHVSVPSVEQTIEFRARAVLVRNPTSAHPAPWDAAVPTQTRLTAPDAAIRDAARSLGSVRDVLETADAISDLINSSFDYAHDATSVHTTAADAWQLRRGVCQDMAHVMIAICTSLGICSRYVSGHLVGDGASHAWTEVLDPARQVVVAIDPTHRRRTDLRYITTAIGRDYHDVAPTSGIYTGHGSRGTLRVDKVVRLAEVG